MGTETRRGLIFEPLAIPHELNYIIPWWGRKLMYLLIAYCNILSCKVKLNNPLMGTETMHLYVLDYQSHMYIR